MEVALNNNDQAKLIKQIKGSGNKGLVRHRQQAKSNNL